MEEAEKIYHSLFKEKIPLILNQRFQEATEKIIANNSNDYLSKSDSALGRIKDLEALEMAARFKRRLPSLSLKFRIMVFLAETLPQNQRIFVNAKDNSFKAWASLLFSGIRSVFKFFKGIYLLRNLKNV